MTIIKMAVVADLTDAELRAKLQSLGQNVGPITKTTRKLLEKKLQKLLDGPSDEIKSVTTKPTEKKITTSRSSRRSSAGRRAPNSALPDNKNASITREKKFAPFSSDEEESDFTNRVNTRSINTSPIGFPTPPQDVLNTVAEVNNDKDKSRLRGRRSMASRASGSLPHVSALSLSTKESTRVPSNKKSIVCSEFSDDDFPQTASQSKTNIKEKSILLNGKSPQPATESEFKTHITPNQRFITARHTPTATSLDESKIRDEIDKSLIQIRNSFSSKKPSPPSRYLDQKTSEYKRAIFRKEVEENDDLDEDCEDDMELDPEFVFSTNIMSQNIKYFVIPFCIIFLMLAIGLYFYSDDGVLKFPVSDQKHLEDNLMKNLELIDHWYKHLTYQAGLYECGYNVTKTFSEEDMIEIAKKNYEDVIDVKILKKSLDLLKNESYSNYITYVDYMYSSTGSNKPLICRIFQAVSVIIRRVLLLCTLLVVGLAFYYIMKSRWTKDDEETRQILYFVDKILDTLRRHHEICLNDKDTPPYLPIPHVRDMLIPLAKRKKMAKIWQKAVQFLNSSDSRVRVETKEIEGEDFEVWRWIGISTPKYTKHKNEKTKTRDLYPLQTQTKCWQGPAFDEIERVVRMPIVTPTPCLKIRYMHEGPDEKGKDWTNRVRDAVLEKCINDGAQILHICVDSASKEGCVYIKCDGLESAGKAFRGMYGNWFDGRLVIVKFVTLARYHQRFPGALHCTTSLTPSPNAETSFNLTQEDND